MNTLLITEKRSKDYILLEIAGPINNFTESLFEKNVYGALQEHNTVLDLSKVDSLSSFGLGVLMASIEIAKEQKRHFYILNSSKIVWQAIEATGFSNLFKIIDTIEQVFD